MRSIAIFPCRYTYGASILGELSAHLHLKMYTDDMLFSDVSGQFGISAEELEEFICGPISTLRRYLLKRRRYVNLLQCSLDAQRRYTTNRRLYYGLHTSLLDYTKDRVIKVLIFDDEEHRVKRAMQQEGISEKVARKHIQRHDKMVSNWTRFLFSKEAYDHSLHDVVIPVNNKYPLDITTEIIQLFKNVNSLKTSFQTQDTLCSSSLRDVHPKTLATQKALFAI